MALFSWEACAECSSFVAVRDPAPQRVLCAVCYLNAVVAEIEGNWRSAECVGEEREVFYADLHNPETNAWELLEGQCEVCPNLTDLQWRVVLDRLRALFPNEEEGNAEKKKECNGCGEMFPVSELTEYPDGSPSGGTAPYCRECETADEEEWAGVCEGCGKELTMGELDAISPDVEVIEDHPHCEACLRQKKTEGDILAFIKAHDEDYEDGYEPRFYTVRQYECAYSGTWGGGFGSVEENIAHDLVGMSESGTHVWVVWGGDQLVPLEGDEFVRLYREDSGRLTIVMV